jgi:hypothetical protein
MGSQPGWTRGFVPTATQWNAQFAGKADDLGYSYAQPADGDTLTTAQGSGGWVIDPASDLAALTIDAPAGTFDGQPFVVSVAKTVSALLVRPSGGQSLIAGGPIVLTGATKWLFRLTNATWYPWA